MDGTDLKIIVTRLLLTMVILFGTSVGYRHYLVWSMEMQGKAKLAEATQSRQIQVEQAKAELEAAKDTAEAIRIVGAVAQQYPEYRKQMFIQGFSEALSAGTINQIVYIPTDAGIPILEASRQTQ